MTLRRPGLVIAVAVPALVAVLIGLGTCYRWSRISKAAEVANGALREELELFSANVELSELEVSEVSDFYDDGWAHIVADLSFSPTSIEEVSSTIRYALEPKGYVETTRADTTRSCRWEYMRVLVPSPYGQGDRVEFIFQFGDADCPQSVSSGSLLVQGNPPATHNG